MVVALEQRLGAVEQIVTDMVAKIESIVAGSTTLHPPGLQRHFEERGELERRVDVLERIFLLVDWVALEPSAKLSAAEEDHIVPVFDMTIGDEGSTDKPSEADQDSTEVEEQSNEVDYLYSEVGKHILDNSEHVLEIDEPLVDCVHEPECVTEGMGLGESLIDDASVDDRIFGESCCRHRSVRVYTNHGVELKDLSDAEFQHLWVQGRLDMPPPWAKKLMQDAGLAATSSTTEGT